MIPKIKTGVWQTPHAHHHESRRRLGKLEGWGNPSHGHLPEAHEQTDELGVSPYPPSVQNLFETALRRCASSISIDVDVMAAQPCVAGTRIPVRSILRAIEHYGSVDEALRCYPDLTREQVQDALFFSQVLLEPPRVVN